MLRIDAPPRRLAVVVIVAAVAAALGWAARGEHRPTHSPAPAAAAAAPARTPPATRQPGDDAPLIAVASDGRVTLRVEQQPLQWVLEQIAEQAQWPELAAAVGVDAAALSSARAGVAPTAPVAATPVATSSSTHVAPLACPPGPVPLDASQVQRLLGSAVETERLEGLSQARLGGMRLDERTLRLLFEGDPSEHMRMAAFETYLANNADNPAALRAALQEAQHLPSARIRHDAQMRLDALHALERNALSLSGDP